MAGGGDEIFAGTGKLVGALAVDFDGAKFGHGLRDFAGEMSESLADFSIGGDGATFFSNFALWVSGSGGKTES